MVKFTDARNKDWFMDMARCSPIVEMILNSAHAHMNMDAWEGFVDLDFPLDCDSYVLTDGWDEFVKERNLKAMDVIMFYKFVRPSHEKHFLNDYVKKRRLRLI